MPGLEPGGRGRMSRGGRVGVGRCVRTGGYGSMAAAGALGRGAIAGLGKFVGTLVRVGGAGGGGLAAEGLRREGGAGSA